jgi:hypothetical protein
MSEGGEFESIRRVLEQIDEFSDATCRAGI